MYKQYSETGIKSISISDRYFIPLLPANTKPSIISAILPHTDWVGLNIFDLQRSKVYAEAKRIGSIKDALGLPVGKKVFLTSTERDENLEKFYEKGGIEKLKSDISDLSPDMVMGPDWYVYDDMPEFERTKNIMKAIDLNQKLIDFDVMAPNIHGTNPTEIRRFIEPFKAQGKRNFIMPGREYLINRGDRKRCQELFSALTSITARTENVDLIVTGCGSPKLQQSLPDVKGFVGIGWMVQAGYRRLIFNGTYHSIFDKEFHCDDPDCCASAIPEELAKPEKNLVRYVHNLKKIKSDIAWKPKYRQVYLVN
jgi:hypothetical protein